MMKDLIHYEQFVNDRFGTSAAPPISDVMLPESGELMHLKWRRFPASDARIFGIGDSLMERIWCAIKVGDDIVLPVHPLDESEQCDDSSFTRGQFQVSASYRTVAFRADASDPLAAIPGPGQILMFKLHLEQPLPGIPGDRRLTLPRVEKCVLLSGAIRDALSADNMAEQLEVIPECFGVSAGATGLLMRLMPARGLLPVFSLTSRDSTRSDELPFIARWFQRRYNNDSVEIARSMGRELARPLVRSLLAGFRAGFSLEMHAQNTLITPGDDELIKTVHYRDIEGVIYCEQFRVERGLPPLFEHSDNAEIHNTAVPFARYFNRNLDHDLGRIFRASIFALRKAGLLDSKASKHAVLSVRKAVREALEEADLLHLTGRRRWLPWSRAPYGNGRRLGHYFRTEFR